MADEDYQFEVYTPSGNRKKPSYQAIVNWVSQSLLKVEVSMVKNSFITCGIERDENFKLDKLIPRLRNSLISNDNWDQKDNFLKAINAEDDD